MTIFPPNIKKLEAEGNIDGLIKAAGFRKAEIRLKAFYALSKLLPDDEFPDKLRSMLDDPDPRVRIGVIMKFADMGDRDVYTRLHTIMADGSQKEKIKILRKLSDIDASLIPLVSDIMVIGINDKNPVVQIESLKTMGHFKGRFFLEHLKSKLGDKRYQVRLEAVHSLQKTGTEDALDALIGALVDNNRDVRWAAREAIKSIDNDRARDILKNAPFMLLVKKMSDTVTKRVETAKHIGKHKIEEALPLLRKACSDEYKSVRIEAAKAIGRMHDAGSVSAVAAMLDDEYFDARLEAVLTLEKIFHSAALVALAKARNDASRNVRDQAEKSYYNLKTRLERAGMGDR